jgi:hypothetical protein
MIGKISVRGCIVALSDGNLSGPSVRVYSSDNRIILDRYYTQMSTAIEQYGYILLSLYEGIDSFRLTSKVLPSDNIKWASI